MLPILLAIVPKIFDFIVDHVGTIVSDTQKSSIIQGLEGLAVDKMFGKNALSVIESVMGKIDDSKKVAIQADIDSIIGNLQIDAIEASKSGLSSRELLFRGLSILVLCHLVIAEIANILAMIHGSPLAPMDTMTGMLLTILLGGHIAARTVEKVNSNQDD